MPLVVVPDLNVMAPGILHPQGVPGQCIRLIGQRRVQGVVSVPMLLRLHDVMQRKFRQDFDAAERAIVALSEAMRLVEPFQQGDDAITTDPEDDIVLATAVAGRATHLVTGDKRHLLPLGEHRGVRIVTPRAFLDECERGL